MTHNNTKQFDKTTIETALNKCVEYMRQKEKNEAASPFNTKTDESAQKPKSFFKNLKDKLSTYPQKSLWKCGVTAVLGTAVSIAILTYAPQFGGLPFGEMLTSLSNNVPMLSDAIQFIKDTGHTVMDLLKTPIGSVTGASATLALTGRYVANICSSVYRHVTKDDNADQAKTAELKKEMEYQLSNQLEFNNQVNECLEPVKDMIYHPEVAKMKDVDGNTILDYALEMKDIKMLAKFKKAGVDFNTPDKNGRTFEERYQELLNKAKEARKRKITKNKETHIAMRQAEKTISETPNRNEQATVQASVKQTPTVAKTTQQDVSATEKVANNNAFAYSKFQQKAYARANERQAA